MHRLVADPDGRAAGGTTQTCPDDAQPVSTEASASMQTVAGEVWAAGFAVTPPPSATQLPDAVGPNESPFGVLPAGGDAPHPWGAVVMVSPTLGSPALPSCTWHLTGFDADDVQVHALQLAPAAVAEAIEVP